MSDDLNRVPILGIIGLAALLGAGVLAYFSSVVTLRLERTGTEVTLSYDTRLFNLVSIEQRRHPGVTSVYLRPGREPGSRSRVLHQHEPRRHASEAVPEDPDARGIESADDSSTHFFIGVLVLGTR
jgi:hypothetical protein